MPAQKRKLLLIGCSSRKRRDKGLLCALERYDGVNFQVIRKAMREGYFPLNVDIKILSAKFGLIDAATPIPYYDQRMDKERALELQSTVIHELKQILGENKHSEIFVNMGKVYFIAIDGLIERFSADLKVSKAEGGIGSKMKAMRDWLVMSQE